MNGAARLINDASPTPTNMRHIVIDQKSNEHPQPAVAIVQTNNPTPISLKGLCIFANDANMGEAINNPTINADDSTPSSKLFRLKSPLYQHGKGIQE
jgi:hypothetical protein